MLQDLTEIVMVVDRSGSMGMSGKRQGAIEGFNTFLREQQQGPGDANLTLILFDHEQQRPYARTPIHEVPPLDYGTFVPRGNTALYDALGDAIAWLGHELSLLDESMRPGKVIIATLTDGLENASRRWTHERLSEAIRHQTEKYGWEFFFLASELKAREDAQALGVMPQNIVANADSRVGTQMAFAAASANITERRTRGH